MARANISRPGTLADLVVEARSLGLQFEIPASPAEWPLWSADHPYRQYSCDKKSPYLYAEGALSEAISAYRLRGIKLRVYPCPLGIHYHHTSKESWEEWPAPPVTA
jgi:hypothetical protein